MTSAKGRSGRILHVVTDLRTGGTQRLLLRRVEGLPAYEHHVLAFAPRTGRIVSRREEGDRAPEVDLAPEGNGAPDGNGAREVDGLSPALERAGAQVHLLGLRTPARAALAVLSGALDRRLDALARTIEPDLIHSTLFHAHVLADRLASRTSAPHLASKEGTDDWMRSWHRRWEARALSRADAITAVSEAAASAVRRLGVTTPVGVIRNGIDPAEPGAWAVPPADGGFPHLLGVGRIEEVKGWRDLLRALPPLCREWPALRWDLVGDGSLTDSLRREARELGIERHVRIISSADARGRGPQRSATSEPRPAPSDSPSLFAPATTNAPASPIVLVPSHEEGFGLVLLEAMARGLPVIASRVGGMAEIARPEVDAILIPPRSPREIERAIRTLVDDPARAAALGSSARERARAFDLAEMLRGYDALYASMIDAGAAGRGSSEKKRLAP